MVISSLNGKSPGEIIRARRQEFGWTQEELAAEAGVGLSTLQFIEGGRDFYVKKSLRKIARALHLNPGDIVRWVA